MPCSAPVVVGVRIAATLFVGAVCAGCASNANETDPRRSRDASSAPLDAPEGERKIQLTLWPFWEIPVTDAGVGTPLPLGGVEVCVAKKRPYLGKWKDFADVQGVCTTSVEKTAAETGKVVLTDVPGPAELIITASKDGYRPVVFAVTTNERDLDITSSATARDTFSQALIRSNTPWSRVDRSVAVDEGLGSLSFYPSVCITDCGFLGGVRVSLEPSGGNGPFYFLGGRWVPNALASVPGDLILPSSYAGATFVNLKEGEYRVTVSQPNAFCNVLGSGGSPLWGFVSDPGVIRAPVLLGHMTATIVAECNCKNSSDRRTCAPASEGGTR
jgi:hypothetical protein